MKKYAVVLIVFCIMISQAFAETLYEQFLPAADHALQSLSNQLRSEQQQLYVYKDFADSENHYTQKAKMSGIDPDNVYEMDENWRTDPWSGKSCICCRQFVAPEDWGGWLFLNGRLNEDGKTVELNDGKTGNQGLDLSGAQELRFYARGEEGGETVEFFTCGFGRNDLSVSFPDSAGKHTLGLVTLTRDWQEYVIDLRDEDMSYIALGFGYVMNGTAGYGLKTFFLDEIRFTGKPSVTEGGYYLIRSYNTNNQYIYNAAFTYDNALAAMAFISEEHQEEAAEILDSFVFAVENDRWKAGRIRNAYVAGNISSFTGWAEEKKARLPGWYDEEASAWYEDQYQTGSNVGNTSYAALALLQYDRVFGNEKYLSTACALMDWVIDECGRNDGPGFTAGYDGWPENGQETTYMHTYKSIEHNIDAYAVFRRLYAKTGDERYQNAAENALAFIRSMYCESEQLFYTGTENDGLTANKGNVVLDAQVWCCMALGNEFSQYINILKTVADMETPEGGYPFCRENRNGGFWAEGTAYTALMYRMIGDDEKAVSALKAVTGLQLDDGQFPAASVDHLSTGFTLFTGAPWEYGRAPHIAPTAWYVMAVNGFNPYAF